MTTLDVDATRVVLLAEDSRHVRQFAAQLPPERLVGCWWEHPPRAARRRLWQRRLRRHGVLPTASRLCALALDHLLHAATEGRGRSVSAVGGRVVADVNAPSVVASVAAVSPTLVIVVGTSLLRAPLLEAVPGAVFLNVHVGRTPTYRGTHGGAWAVLEDRLQDVATTIHVVDRGVDTGTPVAFLPAPLAPTLTALARSLVVVGLTWLRAVVEAGRTQVTLPQDLGPRRELRYPPTFAQWLRFRRRVRRALAEAP